MSVTGHQYKATRVRGLAPWSPTDATRQVLGQVDQVIDEFRDYLPITVRQVFYRLVGAYGFEKSDQAYKRLLEYVNRGRRSGMISWYSFRDDRFESQGGGGWDNPQQVIDSTIYTAEAYKRDRQDGQPFRTEIWVEAAGMIPQVAKMVRQYSIPVASSGGFNGTGSKHEMAQKIIEQWDNEERPTRILHIGDFDPSGVAIVDSLADDINHFIEDSSGHWAEDVVQWHRAVVTPEQIERYDLPGAPPNPRDNRSGFEAEAVQAEALSPPQLELEILAAVRDEWDQDIYERLLAEETEERDRLIESLRDLSL